MAVVGEARIIVRADTSAVKEQIRRGFAGSEKVAADAGEKVSKSFSSGLGKGKSPFDKLAKESESLAKSFHRAIRNSYKWQAATGALVQSISVLGNGLLALAGNIGGAVAAGGALIGLMAQMKVTSLVAKQAFSGIMKAVTASTGTSKQSIKELREEMQQLAFAAEEAALGEEAAALKLEEAREALARAQSLPPDNRARREAELAYQQADLAYRKAKDKAADALDEVQNPKKKKNAGTDPFADLTKTQREFAIYLKSVMPRFKELREAAASSFLPTLTEQMKEMFSGGFFEMLVKGFGDVSKGLSQATKAFAKTLFDPSTKSNLAEFFKSSSRSAGTMGNVLGNAFSGFLTLMKALDPLISRFTGFLNSKAAGFADNMKANFGPITAFFKNAGDAAAGWGAIIGRVFGKLKDLIKANIGPGSGGQLLLDWMNQGKSGFQGLDGAAAEFARKNYFLSAAENMKAMFQSLGQIFSVFQGLAASPDVKQFWETLSGLSGPLEEVLTAAMGSSDEFAKLVVAVAEIAAAFADVGQLQAYMTILAEIVTFFANLVNLIKPILQAFGPLVGAIGATVTIMLIFKKVTMLTAGTVLILTKGIKSAVITFRIFQALLATGAIAQQVFAAKTTISTLATNKQKVAWYANILAMKLNQMTIGGTAIAQTALGQAFLKSIPSVAGFGATLWAALLPILPIILAIVAAIAVVAGAIAIFNHINTENSKKALKALNKEFKTTNGEALGAAQAQDQWTASMLSISDSAKSGITDVRVLGQALAAEADNPFGPTMQGMQTSLRTFSTGLADVAKKSLPNAQRQLRNFIVTSGMSRSQVEANILSNEDYTKALDKQAKAMGDTIYNMDGTINKQKAMDYAIGEGTYLVRKAAIERDKLNKVLQESYQSFIDVNGPLQQSAEDLKGYGDVVYDTTKKTGFSLKKYIKDLTSQTNDADDWMKRMQALAGNVSDDIYKKLAAMGKDGMGLLQSLTTVKKGIVTINEEALADYVASQAEMIKAQEKMKAATAAVTDPSAILSLLGKKGTGRGMAAIEYYSGLASQIRAGTLGITEAMGKAGITFDELIKESQNPALKKADLANKVNISAAWDEGTLTSLRTQLLKNVGGITLYAKAAPVDNTVVQDVVGPWTGGLIWNNSLIKKFADGGKVYGPGGPVDDRVPAMLSNGEFVVNAAATSKNLALLSMINQSKQSAAMGGPQNNVSMTINAAPGMNEQEIANLVSAKLNFELSRGMNS